MKVIDASSLAKYIHREENWELVKRYLLEGCITIELCIKEVLNSIWKRWRRGELNRDLAEKLGISFLNNEMVKVINQTSLFSTAFKISLNNKITIYDALYISLAIHLNSELVTSDHKQYEIAKKLGVKTIYIP